MRNDALSEPISGEPSSAFRQVLETAVAREWPVLRVLGFLSAEKGTGMLQQRFLRLAHTSAKELNYISRGLVATPSSPSTQSNSPAQFKLGERRKNRLESVLASVPLAKPFALGRC